MITQLSAQEAIKKEFISIFEISLLFDVSGITARRYINGIFKEIELLESKLKSADQNDPDLINQKIKVLSDKVRRRVIGQTKIGEDIFILELARKEALENWDLRPSAKDIIQKETDQVDQSNQTTQTDQTTQNIQTDQTSQGGNQQTVQAISQENPQNSLPRAERYEPQNLVTDIYGQKYISLMESQLVEKDNTIKDLRETNKFLSITNGKLNEQLRFLLEKPSAQNQPPQNII
jgi:hypothetical protein